MTGLEKREPKQIQKTRREMTAKMAKNDSAKKKRKHDANTASSKKFDPKRKKVDKGQGSAKGKGKGKGKSVSVSVSVSVQNAAGAPVEDRDEIATKLNKLTGSILLQDKDVKERDKEVGELYDTLKTKFSKYSARHDLSRAIQTCFRFGTDEMKDTILEELTGKMEHLSKGRYSSFLVIALLRYGNEKQRGKILNEFRGHMKRLATHNCGSTVLDFAFSNCDVDPKKRKRGGSGKDDVQVVVPVQQILRKLRNELYGVEFAIFGQEQQSKLSADADITMFKSLDKKKRRKALYTLSNIATKQAEKGILRFGFAQWVVNRLIMHCETNLEEYKDEENNNNSSSDAAEEDGGKMMEAKVLESMIPLITEACLAMVSTTDGASAVARCIAHGSAKDRKKFVRILKGHIPNLCFHPHGYRVLLALLNTVDDTVMMNKTVMDELTAQPVLERLVASLVNPDSEDSTGRMVFLQVFAPGNPRYLSKVDVELITPAPGTSKKDAEVRAQEIQPTVTKKLTPLFLGKSAQMLKDKHASDVLVETLSACWPSENLQEVADAIDEELLEHPVGQRAIKRLIKNEATNNSSEFSAMVFNKMKPKLKNYAKVNRACFILAALLENPAIKATVQPAIAKLKKEIEKGDTAGGKIVLGLLK